MVGIDQYLFELLAEVGDIESGSFELLFLLAQLFFQCLVIK